MRGDRMREQEGKDGPMALEDAIHVHRSPIHDRKAAKLKIAPNETDRYQGLLQ